MKPIVQEALSQLKKTRGKRKFPFYEVVIDIQNGLEPAQRLAFAQEFLALAERIKDIHAQANAHNALGGAYHQLRKPDESAYHFQQALAFFETLSIPSQVAKLYRNIGIVFWEVGDYNQALTYYQKSLSIVEDTDDTKGIARTYNNLGSLYGILNRNEEALNYFEKALDLAKKEQMQTQIAYLYNNIGEIHLNNGDPKRALEYMNLSIEASKTNPDKANVDFALLNIGKAYRLLHQNEAAKESIRSCQNLVQRGQDFGLQASCALELARIEISQGQYRLAVDHLEAALVLAEKSQVKSLLLEIYKELTETLPIVEDYRKAVDYFRKYVNEKENYFSEKTAKTLAEMETRARIQKMTQEAEFLKQKNEALKTAFRKMEQIARTDELTGLPNRREIMRKLKEQVHLYERKQIPFTVAIADLDFFKNLNDTYGHLEGDKVLKKLGKVVSSTLRGEDFIGRWGGEEFLLIFPATALAEATIVAERIRAKVEKTSFSKRKRIYHVTLTIGLAQMAPERTIDDLVSEADQWLYQGKAEGRNRVRSLMPS
ncbi:MAG TPA: diguanylate cyclase [Thermotogota bacterium]|nr:diguanylate cyclase [Thermotogota bacterium]